LEAVLRSTAVRLFVERAQAHKPAFELTEREAPAVAELVARLEGIPLALELAAARVRSLSVVDINTRLKDRYKILTGGSRVLQERQQTLRALVDWSYDLLHENDKVLLNRLAVFVGGFVLEAAEAICGSDPLTTDDVLDLMASLVEKSLVMMEESDHGTRYRMLETIREYASEKLEQSAETAIVSNAHCQYFFAMAKAANKGLIGVDHASWIQRVEMDIDNVRAAIGLALRGEVDPMIAVKFAVALQGFWWLRGYATEGRKLVQVALELPAIQASDMAQAWALYVGAALAGGQSDHATALQMLETCLDLRRRLGNPVDIAATLSTMTPTRMALGDLAQAREGEVEALKIFRELVDKQGEAIGLLHLGQIGLYEGDDASAQADLERGLVVARSLKHMEVQAECELMLGLVALESADWPRATQCFTRSLKMCKDNGDTRGQARATWYLAKSTLHDGDFEASRTQLTTAIRVFRKFEMSEELIGCLEDFAHLDHARGQWLRSVRTLSIADQMRGRAAIVGHVRGAARTAALVEALKARLPHSEYDTAWVAGQQIEVEAALLTALLN
jgi:tetratricopeptide (TPR) repeat protein